MRVKIKQTKDRTKEHFGIGLVVVVMIGVFGVWAIQLKTTINSNLSGVSREAQDVRKNFADSADLKRDLEEVLPALNEDLDSMIASVRATVNAEVINAAVEDATRTALAEEIQAELDRKEELEVIIVDETIPTEIIE